MKTNKEWLKQLKPGDEVVYSYNRGFSSSENIRKVDKITPKGFIKVGDVLFYPDTGYSRGDYGCSIYKPTEAIKKRIYETAIIKKARFLLGSLKNSDITYERALAIIKLFTEEPKQEAAQEAAQYADNQTLKEAT